MRLTAILAAVAAALCLTACSGPEPFGDGGPIAPDQAVRGALEADDERLETGEHTDVWTFTAAPANAIWRPWSPPISTPI